MNIYWAYQQRKFVPDLSTDASVTAATLVLRDVEPITIAVLNDQSASNKTQPWLAGELGAGETLLFGVKLTAAATDYLASQNTWTLANAGSAARYTADLNLNTVELIAAMGTLTSLACKAELTLVRSDGYHAYSTQMDLTILRDINVGTEGVATSGNPPMASVQFVLDQIDDAVAPSGALGRIRYGQIQIYNKTTATYRAAWLEGAGTAEHLCFGEAAT